MVQVAWRPTVRTFVVRAVVVLRPYGEWQGGGMDPKKLLTEDEVAQAELAGWRMAGKTLVAVYETGDFATGLRLVNRIGDVAETANHHPDVTLTYPSVTLALTSHDVDGVTARDVDLAGRITRVAKELGIAATAG